MNLWSRTVEESMREKEWDEPGPDFGKTIYRPDPPLGRKHCPVCEPEAQRRYQASGDRHMKVLDDARWQVHGVEGYCRKET